MKTRNKKNPYILYLVEYIKVFKKKIQLKMPVKRKINR
jgi:hypothetical protein